MVSDVHPVRELWYAATVAGYLDSQTVGEVFRKHGPAVYRRAYRILGSKADAEEAAQEVFIRALRSGDSFRGNSQITTWLYRVTTYYCLNVLRDRKRRRELLDEHTAETSDAPPSSTAPTDLILLRRLLTEADQQQARAAVYVYLDGMTHDEAAELLEVSKRTVGNLIERFCAWASKQSAEVAPRPKPSEPLAPAKRRG